MSASLSLPTAGVPATTRRAGLARSVALAYIFAIFPITPAFVGFAALRPPGVSLVGVPLAFAVFVGAVISAVVLAWPRGGEAGAATADLAPLRRPLLAFLASAGIATVFGIDPATGMLDVAALLISAVVHAGVLRHGDAPALRRVLYGVFLVSAALAATIGLVAWATGVPAELLRVVNGRAVGTFVVPGEFAGYLVLALATATGIAASRRGALRLAAWAVLAAGIPALAATYSRAGWFGCSVAMATIVCIERPRPRVVAAAAVLLALEVPLLLGMSDHHNPAEEFVRIPIWIAALRTASLFPLTGTGPGAFRHLYAQMRPPTELAVAFHPHSAILGTLTESGLLGLGCVLALTVVYLRLFARRLTAAHPARRPVAVAIFAGLVGTAVQASVDEIQVLVLGCWLPFMALSLVEADPGAP